MARRWWVLGGVVLLIVVIALAQPRWLMLVWRMVSADSIERVATYLRSFGVWTPLASLGLMVLQSVVAPLPGSLIAAANGVVFGIWWGTLLSWLGGLLGGSLSFAIARCFGRGVVARFVAKGQLERADRLSATDGFWLVLVARLIPLISFDLISYLAGLSRLRYRSFLLATAIGMLPGSFAWTALGHDLAQAQTTTWRLSFLALFAVVATLAARWWMRRAARDSVM